MKKYLIRLLFPILLIISITSCDLNRITPNEANKTKVNVLLGAPDNTTYAFPKSKSNFLIERESYVLSYNDSTHNPNWVSWHIEKSDLGKLSRPGSFYSDPLIPSSWDKVHESDYQYSTYGFSRGHMCPNGDRNGNKKMQQDTFYMSNMIPQVQVNNGGPWQRLEEHIQEAVLDGYEAYVISGPYGTGGVGYNDKQPVPADYIRVKTKTRDFKINVPEYTWKVALVIPDGVNDINRINSNSQANIQAYAVWIPNSYSEVKTKDPFEKYLVTIDFVEEMTGYDFFSLLDDKIENRLEKIIPEIKQKAIDPTFDEAC